MDINLTLFVQMFHFFVAWYLLNRFYFRPTIAVLDEKDHEREQLLDSAHKLQTVCAHKQQEKTSLWRMLKRFSHKHAPESACDQDLINKGAIEAQEPKPVDEQRVKQLRQEMAQHIIQRAARVDE